MLGIVYVPRRELGSKISQCLPAGWPGPPPPHLLANCTELYCKSYSLFAQVNVLSYTFYMFLVSRHSNNRIIGM